MSNAATTAIDEAVLSVAAEIRALAAADPDAAGRVTDVGVYWVRDQALAGAHLPMNAATLSSLIAVRTAMTA